MRAVRIAMPVVLIPLGLVLLGSANVWTFVPALLVAVTLVVVAGQVAVDARWTWLPLSGIGLVFGLAISALIVLSHGCFGMNSGHNTCVPHGWPLPIESSVTIVLGLCALAQGLTFDRAEEGGTWIAASVIGGLLCGIAIDGLPQVVPLPLYAACGVGGAVLGAAMALAAYLITREPGRAMA